MIQERDLNVTQILPQKTFYYFSETPKFAILVVFIYFINAIFPMVFSYMPFTVLLNTPINYELVKSIAFKVENNKFP